MRYRVAYARLDEGSELRLSTGEREDLERFRDPGRRASFVAGRLAAHRALEAIGAGSLEVRSGPSGEPVVSGPGLRVSISHSGGLAVAVAFEGRARVGIDIEQVRPIEDDIAELVCSTLEREKLEQVADVDRRRWELLRLWTLKEAIYKASFPEGDSNPREIGGDAGVSAPGWQVERIEREGYVGALVFLRGE